MYNVRQMGKNDYGILIFLDTSVFYVFLYTYMYLFIYLFILFSFCAD